ncbi:MAG TPA: hypothetical protein VGM88_10205 [Kofleriaceae bacterium]|jgi:hypothetical protein
MAGPRHRLGELLVAAKLLGVEQVEQALRAQVMWGGRLGTNLIELGFFDLDELSKALGRQHRLPAAFAKHFDAADRDLQRKLSVDIAERFECIPIREVDGLVIVASVAPLTAKALAIVADELGAEPTQLVPAIAAELRIRYHLERVYRIPRSARFLRPRGETTPPTLFQIAPVPPDSEPDLVLPSDEPAVIVSAPPPQQSSPGIPLDLPQEPSRPIELPFEPVPDEIVTEVAEDDLAVAQAPAVPRTLTPIEREELGKAQRRYLRTLADEPSSESERAALGRIAIRRIAVRAEPGGPTLGEATRAIRRGTDRDRVGELVIDAIDRFTAASAAILLVVRGGVAIGWKGFSRDNRPLAEIAVPVDDDGGLLTAATAHGLCCRRGAQDLSPIDRLLLTSLGRMDGDLVVAPVAIGEQVLCMIALAVVPDEPTGAAETIAAAAGAAFARLMRDASR